MKKWTICIAIVMTLITTLTLLAGCPGNEQGKGDADTPITQIVFDNNKVELRASETLQLNYTVTPSNATAKIEWQSTNTSIATVTSNGTIKGISKGNCKVVASSGSVSVTIDVVVKVKGPDYAKAYNAMTYKEYFILGPEAKFVYVDTSPNDDVELATAKLALMDFISELGLPEDLFWTMNNKDSYYREHALVFENLGIVVAWTYYDFSKGIEALFSMD